MLLDIKNWILKWDKYQEVGEWIEVYHIKHINSLHSNFKTWIRKFNGVATKYINNYLFWFKFLKISKKNKKSDRVLDLLTNVASKDITISLDSIKNRHIEYV